MLFATCLKHWLWLKLSALLNTLPGAWISDGAELHMEVSIALAWSEIAPASPPCCDSSHWPPHSPSFGSQALTVKVPRCGTAQQDPSLGSRRKDESSGSRWALREHVRVMQKPGGASASRTQQVRSLALMVHRPHPKQCRESSFTGYRNRIMLSRCHRVVVLFEQARTGAARDACEGANSCAPSMPAQSVRLGESSTECSLEACHQGQQH